VCGLLYIHFPSRPLACAAARMISPRGDLDFATKANHSFFPSADPLHLFYRTSSSAASTDYPSPTLSLPLYVFATEGGGYYEGKDDVQGGQKEL
jgi:hypothetical protein